MPNQSQLQLELAPTSYGTYGATGIVTYSPVKQIGRTRRWSNSSLRTARQRAQRILASGYLPTQAYQDDLQHVVNSSLVTMTGQLNSQPNSTFTWRFIPGVSRIHCSVTDTDATLALNRALDKLQGEMTGVGVSVPLTIADAGKTASMIGEAAGRLFKSYRHLRHGNFKAAATALGLERTPNRVGRHRSLEDNWLEYRYGWRLVVYDITSYMNQIHNMLTTRPIVHRVTKTVTSSSARRYSEENQRRDAPGRDGIALYTRWRSESRDVMASAGYIYALESVPLSLGQELGLLNPVSVAWDLIPASFMVDWAVNVSSVLEGLTAFQGKKFLDGWTCIAVHTKRTEWWTDIRKGAGIYKLNPGSSFYAGPVEERRFGRSGLSQFHPAQLRLDFRANFQHGIDGLALIKQVFGSGSRKS